MNSLVKQIVLLLQPQAQKHDLIIKHVFSEDPLFVFADNNRIRQVLYNLVNNSIKFSYLGQINIILIKKDELISVIIKDQGIGIEQEEQEKIFTSFTQVDGSNSRAKGGIGLGLAISKDIIELHGQELVLKSELGKGAEFSFKLTSAKP